MEVKELINSINKVGAEQTNYPDIEMLEDFEGKLNEEEISSLEKIVKVDPICSVDAEKHRWYEVSTNVYETPEENVYLGIRVVTDLFSESMDYESCCHSYKAYLMEKVSKESFKKSK